MCVSGIHSSVRHKILYMLSSILSHSVLQFLLQGQVRRRVARAGSSLQAYRAIQFGWTFGISDDLSPVHFPFPHGDHQQRGKHHAAQREQTESGYDTPIQVGTYPGAFHLQPLHLPGWHAVPVHHHVPRHSIGDDHQGDPGHQERDCTDKAVVYRTSRALSEGEIILGHEGKLR